ncbi:hypothetical protein [Natrinema salaciae]|uniref:Winged helix-turn-helix DNA-binding n=1 Tax=Natrinema salaciae TaxID=1186196 RepID=A0A1H9NJY3_9EURY|nr:hypothetical protein [Natrinema salaciae]SER36246.1 hypothetical protein SAMN04489841_3631 [Natrinema salaciae]
MSEPERLNERIVAELERTRHTHKSLRRTISEEYGYSDGAITRAISALDNEGTIKHEQGYFELATDRQ